MNLGLIAEGLAPAGHRTMDRRGNSAKAAGETISRRIGPSAARGEGPGDMDKEAVFCHCRVGGDLYLTLTRQRQWKQAMRTRSSVLASCCSLLAVLRWIRGGRRARTEGQAVALQLAARTDALTRSRPEAWRACEVVQAERKQTSVPLAPKQKRERGERLSQQVGVGHELELSATCAVERLAFSGVAVSRRDIDAAGDPLSGYPA